jgi:RNA polymerase sigma-70 factor (ECF subfamily)
MDLTADSDLDDVSGGEAAALRHRPDLVRFLVRRLRRQPAAAEVAEDLAQEAYLRLLRSAEPVRNVRGFLFHVAANLANNHQRLERRRAELRAEIHDLLAGEADETTAERQALAADALRRIADVLPNLPERTRQILVLSRFEGLSAREIGRRLGISGPAVEKHIQKALRQLLKAADPGENP